MRRFSGAGLVAAALLPSALGGCGLLSALGLTEKKPESPPPKEIAMTPPAGADLKLTLIASPLVNPDLDGRPSPVVVRVYQLASPEAFQQADFMGLYEKDEKTLGKSLLGRAELILEPGGVKAIASPLNPAAAFIGIVVGYREFETAKWRALFPLQGRKHAALRASLLRLSADLQQDDD